MEIIDFLNKKCISYGGSLLMSETEEKIINFYNECVENDKKYSEDLK